MLRKLLRMRRTVTRQPRVAGTDDSGADADWLTADPQAEWIWANKSKNGQQVHFRKPIELNADVKSAKLYSTCDNKLTLYLNGKKVGSSPDWPQPIQKEVGKQLRKGKNIIAADCRNDGGIAAFVLKMVIELADGSTQTIVSDKTWKLSEKADERWRDIGFDDSAWVTANRQNSLGAKPWGIPQHDGDSNANGGMNPRDVMVPPGFVVDLVHETTSDQGSWVSLTTDPKGRIYACDQGKAGLFRITLRDGEEPLVEKVDTGATKDLSGAQGLLWAFDALWFHRNGGHLYRVTDSNNDDQLDTVEDVPGGTSGGEHGNHAVILSADGKKLLLDGGNHAALGEYVATRVQQWNEGLLLPRMWDARGHARGRMAPGGWVTEVDPTSYEQILHTIGFRNQYDIALNRFGDIFTFRRRYGVGHGHAVVSPDANLPRGERRRFWLEERFRKMAKLLRGLASTRCEYRSGFTDRRRFRCRNCVSNSIPRRNSRTRLDVWHDLRNPPHPERSELHRRSRTVCHRLAACCHRCNRWSRRSALLRSRRAREQIGIASCSLRGQRIDRASHRSRHDIGGSAESPAEAGSVSRHQECQRGRSSVVTSVERRPIHPQCCSCCDREPTGPKRGQTGHFQRLAIKPQLLPRSRWHAWVIRLIGPHCFNISCRSIRRR